jgi:hypothetical protein
VSAPDVPTVTLRPTLPERIGGVYRLVIVSVILGMLSASTVPPWFWLFFLVPSAGIAAHAWSVLTSRVVLSGPTLTARNPLGTRRLTRRDVVRVVQITDWLGSGRHRHRPIAALELTAGGVLPLRGAPWKTSHGPLQQWLDFHSYAVGWAGEPPDLGVGRQGWSGPVVR